MCVLNFQETNETDHTVTSLQVPQDIETEEQLLLSEVSDEKLETQVNKNLELAVISIQKRRWDANDGTVFRFSYNNNDRKKKKDVTQEGRQTARTAYIL